MAWDVSFEVSASLATTDYDDGDALASNIADVLVSDDFSDALRAADATFEEAVMDPSSVGTVVAEPARRPSALPTTLKPSVARAQDEDEDEDEEDSSSSDDGSDDGGVGSVAKKKKKAIRRIGAASSSVLIAASVVLVLIFALCVGGVRCCARQRYKGSTRHSDASVASTHWLPPPPPPMFNFRARSIEHPSSPRRNNEEGLETAGSPVSPMHGLDLEYTWQRGLPDEQPRRSSSSWGLETTRRSTFAEANPMSGAGGAMSRAFTAPSPTNRDDRRELRKDTGTMV